MKNISLFLLLTTMLAGCDAIRRINMKNNTSEKAEITWTIKEDSINSSPFFISNARDVTFELYPEKPYNLIKMSFGYGTWHARQLQNLIDDFDSVVIKSKNGSQTYSTEEEIRNFLMPKRKRIDKSRIDILIAE